MPKDQNESPPSSPSRASSLPASTGSASSKRSQPPHPLETPAKRHVDLPAKKQSKWTAEEDATIIELRQNGMKWEDISKRLPGRSAISCRLHYQNYLERRSEWDEERKNKLARLYERFKHDMWSKIAEEMAVPWRAAEAMHWQIGEQDMARRAGVVPFSLSSNVLENPQPRSRRGSGPSTRAKREAQSRPESSSSQQVLPSVTEATSQSFTYPSLSARDSSSSRNSPTEPPRLRAPQQSEKGSW